MLDNFPSSVKELSLETTKQKLIIKNHIDHPDKDVETVRLKWGLKGVEFVNYDIARESNVIFTLQDFKSVVHLADGYDSTLKIEFTEEGE